MQLKSVRVHFAYGRIALMLELLGRFGRFLDEDDRRIPPVQAYKNNSKKMKE